MLRIILWGIVILIVVQNVGMVVLGRRIEKQFDAAAAFNSHLVEPGTSDQKTYKIEGVDEVLNFANGNGRVKPGFKSLAMFGDINAPRLIRFSISINPKTLLKEIEEAPEKEFLDIFVQARSVKYGQEECNRLSEILTSKCVVKGSHTTSYADGNYKMTFALGFVQKSEFGQIAASKQAIFHEITQTFKTPPRRTDYSGEEAKDERANLYEKIKEQCEHLVEREGNCAISQINMSTYGGKGRSNQQTTSGKVVFSFLHSDEENIKVSETKDD